MPQFDGVGPSNMMDIGFLFKLVSFTWHNVPHYHSFMVLVLGWDIAKWHDITFRYLCGWPNFACSYKRNAMWRFSDNPIIQRYKSFEIMNSLLWTQLFDFNIKWKFERNENFWGQYIWTLFWKKFVQLQNKLVIFAFPSSPSHYHFTILKCKKGPSLILPSSIARDSLAS